MQTGITPQDYARALREKRSVAGAAKALGVSRQTLYAKIEAEPIVREAAEEIHKVADPTAVRDFLRRPHPEMRVLRTDVDLRLSEHTGESFPLAAKEILVTRLQEALGLSKREVVHQLGEIQERPPTDPAVVALYALLPVTPQKEQKEQLTVSLAHAEATWLREKSKGYASDLFSTLSRFPSASGDLPEPQCVTSFLLPKEQVGALKAEAQRQGVTPTILFRTVVRRAMGKAARPHGAMAVPDDSRVPFRRSSWCRPSRTVPVG